MGAWAHDHLKAGTDSGVRVAILHLQRRPQAGFVEAVAAKKAQEHSHTERLTQQEWLPQARSISHGVLRSARRVGKVAGVEEGQQQRDQGRHPKREIIGSLVQGALQAATPSRKLSPNMRTGPRGAMPPLAIGPAPTPRWSPQARPAPARSLRRRSGSPPIGSAAPAVSPPRPMARSRSSAAAAGAPRIWAISAALSRHCSVCGSPHATALARCLACSSGSSTISARRRCIARRRARARHCRPLAQATDA